MTIIHELQDLALEIRRQCGYYTNFDIHFHDTTTVVVVMVRDGRPLDGMGDFRTMRGDDDKHSECMSLEALRDELTNYIVANRDGEAA